MRLIAFLTCVSSAIAATGCVVSPDPAPVYASPSDGALTVDWTINGSKDPNQCNQSSADTIEITVNPGGTYDQACDAFDTSISLAPGSYSASAVLLDGSGRARTTTVQIDPFTIYGGDDLNTPIDFPANSFF